tara:strand:- start:1 stop:2763 length:2763 start_codon:yes stop_codon:yes gene_type:complete
MKPFLEKIAERLIRKFPENMDSISVVLPSKRSVVFLKNYLSTKISKPIFLPMFFSIEEFIENISGLKVLDNVSLQFYLYQSYLDSSQGKVDSFSEFLDWGNILLQDFNDIDTNMVDSKSLFTNITNIKELDNWELQEWSFSNKKLTDSQKNYIEFFASLHDIYKNFKKRLISKNYAYQGLANFIAAEKIKDIHIEWNRVWFVGLNALTKSQHLIIDDLKERDVARVFWDADKYYFDNPEHEASYFLKQQKHKWSEIDFEGIGDYMSFPKNKFQVISCPQNIAQAQVMSKVLSALTDDDLHNSKTAIILADEGLLFPVLNNIPKEVKKLNVTMGSPFKITPFFSFINNFLLLKIKSIRNKKNGFYYKDLFLLLDDPYFKKLVDSQSLKKIKAYIINNNLIFINENEIFNFLDQETFQSIFTIDTDVNDTILQIKLIISLLMKCFIRDKSIIDIEVLMSFSQSIEVVQRLFSDFNFNLDLTTLLSIIERVVSKEIIPFKGEPLEGVQLMGILESRALDFENIIILGVNEGILPKGKIINSLIPYELKRFFKIPSYLERDAIFSYHFYRILQRAKNITLTYNSSLDDFGVGEKSRFITQLLSEYKTSKIDEFIFYDNDIRLDPIKPFIIGSNSIKEEILKWASNGVSPTALNMYKLCSIEFYFHYLLKIREPIQIDEYADNSLMGSAIHNFLEVFYPTDSITTKNFLNYEDKIRDSLNSFYKKHLSENNFNKGKNYLSLKVAEKLLKDFIIYEEELLKENNIQILYKEKELILDFKVNEYNFKLIGNIDRIDLFNNSLRIIDYKSGKNNSNSELFFSDWDEVSDNPKKDKVFQLLMYSYLFLKNNPHFLNTNIIVGIYFLRDLKKGLVPLQKKGGLKFDDDFIKNFEIQLHRIFERMIEDDFKENDDYKLCEFCNSLEITGRT